MPQVRLEVAGIGVSVVGPTQELLYAAVTGVRARGTASSGRLILELAVQLSFRWELERLAGCCVCAHKSGFCHSLTPPVRRAFR